MSACELTADGAVLADRVLTGARLLVRDGTIESVAPASADPGRSVRHLPGILLPGIVDLQVNGGGGRSVGEATPAALDVVAGAVHDGGAVAFLPTLITAPWNLLLEQVAAVARWIDGRRHAEAPLARPLGLHVEGPFLEVPGAHDPRAFVDPTPERVDALLAAAGGHLRLLTLASSRPGAAAAVARLRRAGVAVSIGHVAATQGFGDCVAAGATLVTHLFNAMGPLHHRDPGIAGFALDEPRLCCALIADGAHVHPAMLRNAFAALGPDRVLLASDATAAMGMPDGDYRLGSEQVHAEGGVVRDAAGRLAGSALTMGRAIANFLGWNATAGPWTAGRIASANPAERLGALDHGAIAPGRRAAFSLLRADGSVQALSCP